MRMRRAKGNPCSGFFEENRAQTLVLEFGSSYAIRPAMMTLLFFTREGLWLPPPQHILTSGGGI
jgi:hypothetical protein